MRLDKDARPAAGKHTGRAPQCGRADASTPARRHLDYPKGCLLVAHKHGRRCVLAKLVRCNGSWVIAMPYEGRTEVREYVSLPMAALRVAEDFGARSWILRFGSTGFGRTITLAEARRRGHIQASEGRGELFVPIDAFQPCQWPTWGWVPNSAVIEVDDDGVDEPQERRPVRQYQPSLLEAVRGANER
jgi:hypothetical protein